ncbi:MAG: ABC transporter ATP-binding protein/permease [Armatimonadota bacterium]|nr:ABC transporter ATP-binding protein/permease [Armatimonadota bacterium]
MRNRFRRILWLLRYPARSGLGLLAVLVTMLLKTGLDVLKPWPMKVLVDHVLQHQPMPPVLAGIVQQLPGTQSMEHLLEWAVAATVLIFLLGWGVELASAYAGVTFGKRMAYDLAADLYRHLHRLSLRFHSRHPVGDSIRRVTEDSHCIATIVSGALIPTLTAIISLAVMMRIMWSLDPTLTLLSLAVVPFMVQVFRRYAGPMLERSYEQQEVEGRLYGVIEQTLSAIPVVQAFEREEHEDRRFRANTADILHSTLATTAVQMRFGLLMGLAIAVGTAGILWIGSYESLRGGFSVGNMLVFLSYLNSLYDPLEAIMYSPATVQGAGGSLRRVLKIIDTRPDVPDVARAPALPPVRGHIRFENVTFGYEAGCPVLHDVSLEVRPGQTVAIVGPTGAGKSTLVSLVLRFFDPWQGRVLVDGHDLRQVRLKSVRDQVALVPQEPFLFPLTIAQNIAYGRPDATREEIEAAARAANVHSFIERLPEGYRTHVGERGATLSGGERQRLSIARAFLRDAPILILDEPTSALDAETEGMLLDALERLKQNRTTFIIAHRLSTIRGADRIVALEDGRVVETGTHDELLARGNLYARLYRLQFAEPATVAPPSLLTVIDELMTEELALEKMNERS